MRIKGREARVREGIGGGGEEGVVAGGLTAGGGGSSWVTAGHNYLSAVSVRLAVGGGVRLSSRLRFTGEEADSTRALPGIRPHAFGTSHCGGFYNVSFRE